jgi:glycine cleavage system regulatory protein
MSNIEIVKKSLRNSDLAHLITVTGKDRNYLSVVVNTEFTPQQIVDKVTKLMDDLNISFKEIKTQTNLRGNAHWYTIRKIQC